MNPPPRVVAWAGIEPPPSPAEIRALEILKRTQGYAADFVFDELRAAGLRIAGTCDTCQSSCMPDTVMHHGQELECWRERKPRP